MKQDVDVEQAIASMSEEQVKTCLQEIVDALLKDDFVHAQETVEIWFYEDEGWES